MAYLFGLINVTLEIAVKNAFNQEIFNIPRS